jgi:metal-responsive CopG/Arc/MetJ family transcriptional regulator
MESPRVSFSLPKDLLKKVDEGAKRLNISRASFLRIILSTYFEDHI